jgi:hypothetical protein
MFVSDYIYPFEAIRSYRNIIIAAGLVIRVVLAEREQLYAHTL